MVETAPLAMILICSAGAVLPHSLSRHIGEAVGTNEAHALRLGVIVEVARYDYLRRSRNCPNGIGYGAYLLSHHTAERTRKLLAATPARQVGYDDVQRVARHNHTRRIQQVARRRHITYGRYAHRPTVKQAERKRRIHQRHINAARIGRVGDNVLITCGAQERTLRKVAHHRVVLHLAQRHHIGQTPAGNRLFCNGEIFSSLSPSTAHPIAARHDGLPHAVQLAPIAERRPMVRPVGQKLDVVLQRVVLTIEEVLTVELHEREERHQQHRQRHRLRPLMPSWRSTQRAP